jgi:photosystem II stability/assembly factor-like uncharacterized protein
MAPTRLTADEIISQGNVRGFVQYGKPAPGNDPSYYGIKDQYFFVSGVENPVRGVDPIYMPDPTRRKRYRQVGMMVDPPDIGTYTLALAQRHLAVPRALTSVNCEITTILSVGNCKNPSDLNRGYEDYLYILSQGLVTDRSPGDMMSRDSDDPLMTELTISTSDQYAVGPLFFGETAAAEVNANVIDGAYGYPNDCLTCQLGNERIYTLSLPVGSSPSFQAEVNYSVDGGATWAVSNITGLGVVAQPSAIDVVGEFLVVLVNSTGAYYYAELDADTGVPGTWAAVTGGFVASAGPNDLVVISPTEVYICGDAGYIYRLESVGAPVTVLSAGSATAQPLYRIHSDGTTIVAVGGVGAVIVSSNQGATWAAAQATVTTFTLRAISVRDDKLWFVGSGAGEGYTSYTLNGGKSWSRFTIAGTAPAQINDIVFATPNVGYIAYDIAGPQGMLAYTVDGGASWVTGRARQANNLPVFDRANRVLIPNGESGINANYLTIVGLGGDGSDGIIIPGAANIV